MYKHKMTGSTKKAQSQLRSNARHCQTHPTAAGSWHRHAQHQRILHTTTRQLHKQKGTAWGEEAPYLSKKNSSQTNRTFSKA